MLPPLFAMDGIKSNPLQYQTALHDGFVIDGHRARLALSG
jgi:hypothetical protein